MIHECSKHKILRSEFFMKTNHLIIFREECSSRGGTSEGTCASGFGVCCTCKETKYTHRQKGSDRL